MFHTMMGARVMNLFDEHEAPEWRFVFHSLNIEWFYITKVEWQDDEPVGEHMLLIGDVAELQLLLSAKLQSTSISSIYLNTPGHMNLSERREQHLLLKIEEVADVYPGCANINHIYTIWRNGPVEVYSDQPGDWINNERVVLYDVGGDYLKSVEAEQLESTKRQASIMQVAARIHKNDASASNLWLLTSIVELGARRPIDMTSPMEYDWLRSYISKKYAL
ncbi:hypothetical protein E8E78_03660 [Pseudomonas sp. BN505]|uniref:Uncharacterized protein n=1 Tax=Pseudomonas machongensis TaxID=3110229 RepID=A0ABU5VEG4_9PSED|nr:MULTISPECIES: hypothetical protein [unclassified Pseudomonas]MDH4843005.1 hypothetical protein [Pseudomonas sp. BN605]MDH4845091.1 hypothetical protein [Pseudomonas sp. BN605]MDH4845799.1 hypothetical protein [Pseudomonas sp. BN605]MDH4855707.1 hypothetical protein [Pseudomonas sp. BN505]MEA5671733.1 hypothetical protein [Pseudomonas sp. MH2]